MIAEIAIDIFLGKISSGKYDHYTFKMLTLLFEDCLTDASIMYSINKVSKQNSHKN